MRVQTISSLKELADKAGIKLPEDLWNKSIVLSNPEAIKEDNFELAYNDTAKTIELKYMEHDDWPSDYWEQQDVGELFDGRYTNIQKKFEEVIKSDEPYFLVATYSHGNVIHYLVNSRDEISTCRWDTGISGFFKPSKSFIAECKGNKELMMSQLEGYFQEYTDWCNGEVYCLCKDTYQELDGDLIEISDSDSCGGFIGYEHAKENLPTYL